MRAVGVIQKVVRRWIATVRDPARIKERQEAATELVQKFLRGYQVRRKVEYQVLDARADKMYDYFHRIDTVCKSHFQRRVRRVWLAYKVKLDEKRRKAAEAAAKKKNQRGGLRRTTARVAAPSASSASPTKPTPLNPSPRKPDSTLLAGGALELQKGVTLPAGAVLSPEDQLSFTMNSEALA